jgi:hypothetical protein
MGFIITFTQLRIMCFDHALLLYYFLIFHSLVPFSLPLLLVVKWHQGLWLS